MELISALIAVLMPVLATVAMSGLKAIVGVLGDQSPIVQQIVAVAVGWGVTQLVALTGLPLPVDVHAWDQMTVLGLLNGLAAIGLHAVRKGK